MRWSGIVGISASSLAAVSVCYAGQVVQTLADFDAQGLERWQVTGNAFALTSQMRPGAEGVKHVESLAAGQEGVGTLRSPEFFVKGDVLSFQTAGWDGPEGGPGFNGYFLKRVSDGSILREARPPQRDGFVWRQWVISDLKGVRVFFEVVDGNGGDAFAWLGLGSVVEERADVGVQDSRMKALRTEELAFQQIRDPVRREKQWVYLQALGVPFAPFEWVAGGDGLTARYACGFGADRIFFLGHINSRDAGTPGKLNPGDYTQRLFLGDEIGRIEVAYADGARDAIPLVYGYTAWWFEPYWGGGHTEPFASNTEMRKVLMDALYVKPTEAESPYALVSAFKPRAKVISEIRVADNADKWGYPVISGITFETDAESPALVALPHDMPKPVDQGWLDRHTLSGDGITPEAIAKSVEAVRDRLYVSFQDFPEHVSLEMPRGFAGPRVVLRGNVCADILSNVYYRCVEDMLSKVDADGTFHSSTKGAPSYGPQGIGTWANDQQTYYEEARSGDMGRVMHELIELGYSDKTEAAVEFASRWLLEYPGCCPWTMVGGEPALAHWTRIINRPEMDRLPDHVNAEGHALMMSFAHKAWLHGGRKLDWATEHQKAVEAAAEYVCWQAEQQGRAIPTSALGYAGLRSAKALSAYADIAAAADQPDLGSRWKKCAELLTAAAVRSYGQTLKDGMPTETYGHEALDPLLALPDLETFDAAASDPQWLKLIESAYQRQLGRCHPPGGSPVDMARGQGFITQAALLLDDMARATQFVDGLARYVYFPNYEPYLVPESVEVTSDGRYWYRVGDLGSALAEGEAVKVIRLLLGVDDNQPEHTLLMPRMPLGWQQIEVADYPTLTMDGEATVESRLSYTLKRLGPALTLELRAQPALAKLSVRLGPFPAEAGKLRVIQDEREQTVEAQTFGDGKWIWVRGLDNVASLRLVASG